MQKATRTQQFPRKSYTTKVKVKVNLKQVTKAQKWRCIALLFL